MDANTGYIITEQNSHLIANISGKTLRTIQANLGWAAIYHENPYPEWLLVPKNVAVRIPNFKWADSPLNGLPARTEKEIRAEWAKVNKEYSGKLEELKKELERAEMRDEGGKIG